MESYLYLILNLGTLILPLLWSFESKVGYARKWYALFPAIVITALVYIAWDEWFTEMGVWGFNEKYLTGLYLMNLPLEECLFFFIVPFSTIFIYEVLNYYFPGDHLKRYAKMITYFLIGLFVVVALMNLDKWYTGVNFFIVAILLCVHYYFFSDKLIGRFYFFYLVHLIPFLLFNGALTGAFTSDPVVYYDDMENLGIRIITIPIEDFVYSMGLMLMNVSIYEKIKQRKTMSRAVSY
ncbi:hypothetical protein GCM10028791_23030 [Echinicola sediminis]